MSERVTDSALDAIIDEAARSLTASPAPADLRARALTRIQERESGNRRVVWLIPAAAAVLLAAAVYVFNSASHGSLPAPQTTIAGGQTPGAATGAAAAPRTDSTPVQDLIPPPPAAAVPAGSRRASNDVQVVQSTLPPGFESIALDQDTLPALTLDGLAPLATLDVDSIPIESIRLDALGAN